MLQKISKAVVTGKKGLLVFKKCKEGKGVDRLHINALSLISVLRSVKLPLDRRRSDKVMKAKLTRLLAFVKVSVLLCTEAIILVVY